ncbi:MAG: hypothetical protein Q8S21_01260 [Candidatus Paracaedibacteraceae bacterium]|nr:hypothetical protein [Candidatus Paracaedibacteraceae bacterium]
MIFAFKVFIFLLLIQFQQINNGNVFANILSLPKAVVGKAEVQPVAAAQKPAVSVKKKKKKKTSILGGIGSALSSTGNAALQVGAMAATNPAIMGGGMPGQSVYGQQYNMYGQPVNQYGQQIDGYSQQQQMNGYPQQQQMNGYPQQQQMNGYPQQQQMNGYPQQQQMGYPS